MKKKTSILTGMLAIVALIALLVAAYLTTTSLAKARNDKQSETRYLLVNPNPAANAGTTNAIQVAVAQARVLGMESAPLAMRITQGVYKDFESEGEEDSLYDSKNVYAVWLTTEPFQVIAPGARQRTVTQLVFFVDIQNGHPFGFSYGNSIDPQMIGRAWQSVTLANAGNYPVPVFDPENLIPVNANPDAMPESTATPVP